MFDMQYDSIKILKGKKTIKVFNKTLVFVVVIVVVVIVGKHFSELLNEMNCCALCLNLFKIN